MVTLPHSEFDAIRPKLIPSLKAGLEAVATHIWLILLPIVFDLSLWIAPRLQYNKVIQPMVDSVIEFAKMNPQQAATLPAVQEVSKILLERTNLLFALKTFPIGIPSLFSNLLPAVAPFGKPGAIDLLNSGQILTWWFTFFLVGLILSSIYYGLISRVTSKKTEDPLTLGTLGWLTLQLLLLTVVVILLILFFGFPAMLLISAMAFINPGLGNIALFLGGMLALWLFVPVIFSAHGIFTHHLPVFRSITASIQIVRLTYSSTGLFLLVCVLLDQGLNQLWVVPPENSWLLLVGIFGHSFISTSLFAASFYYYRDGVHFLQTILSKSQMVQPSTPQAIS